MTLIGDDKLIEMTKDFEVLSEGPLRSTAFGEGMSKYFLLIHLLNLNSVQMPG